MAAAEPDFVEPSNPIGPMIGPAIRRTSRTKERACVLLKDVFEYSLEEIAELVESTVGGVKAALNRGRSKTESLQSPTRQFGVHRPVRTNRFFGFTSIDSTAGTGTG
jgi:RNA polymerase sigma-70 factor (ECF subfamily)